MDINDFKENFYEIHKWLREEKGIALNIIAHDGDFYTWNPIFLSWCPEEYDNPMEPDFDCYPSYFEALKAAVTQALKII